MSGGYAVSPVAVSGDRFAHFGPYVPAVAEDGAVAFQAELATGGSGVFIDRGDGARALIETAAPGPVAAVSSHPDLAPDGACCFYGSDRAGRTGVFLARGDGVEMIAPEHGPLGPTVGSGGHAAFRAAAGPGREGIYLHHATRKMLIAETGGPFTEFQGLPVVNGSGEVVFRAGLRDGGAGVFRSVRAGPCEVVRTGGRFRSIGLFPWHDDGGRVGFCGELADGTSGVFIALSGRVEPVIDATAGFESFRGVLLDAAGRAVIIATPTGGRLGVFSGPDPVRDLVFGSGTSMLGGEVDAFALNPVSMNGSGRIAARLAFRDGRHAIVRLDRVC